MDATQPQVIRDRLAAAAATDRLYERRRAAGDPALERMGDTPVFAAGSAAWYAVTHRDGVPEDVLREDLLDVWAIIQCARRELDRLTLAALEAALSGSGRRTLREVGHVIGQNSRQGVEAYLTRLRSAVNGGVKTETGQRAERAHTRRVSALARERADRIRALIVALTERADRLTGFADLTGWDLTDLAALGALAGPCRSGPVPAGVVSQLTDMVRGLTGARGLDDEVRAVVATGADLLGVPVKSGQGGDHGPDLVDV